MWLNSISNRGEDWDKTKFTSHCGTYGFKHMPFGLITAPASFQYTSDMMLGSYDRQIYLSYSNNAIAYYTHLN